MSSAVPPQPPQIPPQMPFKSTQYEFNDEQNRTFSGLSDSMRSFANLMKILGAVVGVLLIVAIVIAVIKQPQDKFVLAPWGTVVTLTPLTILFLTFGLWAGGSAASFRKIAETHNQDVWNLMKALGSLKNMFALLRLLMIAALVLLVVGAIVTGIGAWIDP